MDNKKVMKTKSLRLAEVRYFDREHNGVEIPRINAYVILAQAGDRYLNVFNPGEELPVYDRVPYSNTTMDGVDYGTKIVLASGTCKNGLCYVLDKTKIEDFFFGKEEITFDQLEAFVLRSDLFFIDRMDLMKSKKIVNINGRYFDDWSKRQELDKYFASCGKGVQYHK